MTHPQQDNPKGTKMTDKIDIDALIEFHMKDYPKTLLSKLAKRYIGHKVNWGKLNGANWGKGAFHAGEMKVLEEAITALTEMKAREDVISEQEQQDTTAEREAIDLVDWFKYASSRQGGAETVTFEIKAWNRVAKDTIAALTEMKAREGRFVKLIECLLDNDPDDAIADGGHVVLDLWRHEAAKELGHQTKQKGDEHKTEADKLVSKRAPVQGFAAGIPWEMHLRAYDAYSKKWAPQPALIDLEGRNCRGGFSTGELDEFIPNWRHELKAIDRLTQEQS